MKNISLCGDGDLRQPLPTRRWRLLQALLGILLVLALPGCLDRPVSEQRPRTSNLFVRPIQTSAVPAIDLLFVIDNSISMADKQALLRRAVPVMLERLIRPDCVSDLPDRQPGDGQGCATYGANYFPEFQPVSDMHIGVITSSLGGFGSQSCSDPAREPQKMDKALLIPKVRSVVPGTGESVPNPSGEGFLTWNGASGLGMEAAIEALNADFALHVAASGEEGCGFEAPLEAWYRFLVDPSPPTALSVDAQGRASSAGIDQGILAQRNAFLRPNSLVAIVVLTDENDCSAMEGGDYYAKAKNGWLLAEDDFRFELASAACADNPNDRCCHSCLTDPPAGCPDSCDRDASPVVPEELDRANARCVDGQRRFGLDLLYPTSRYVRGLSAAQIVDSHSGKLVENPLLLGRDPSLVFFAGIVGVPWQDIATSASLADPNRLEYLSAPQLRLVDAAVGADRWEVILGEPGLPWTDPACWGSNPDPRCGLPPRPPLDPFMLQSKDPRSGTNPITGDPIVQSDSSGWSPINGHEYDNGVLLGDGKAANDDLQYSCIFPIEPKQCPPGTPGCDCDDEPSKNRPLCKPSPSAGAAADNTQRYGKAYPAGRILEVLRDFGANSIIGSICPKILDDQSPDFGYNPAVNAIVDRLKSKLTGQCLPRPLDLESGDIPCKVVEASAESRGCNSSERRRSVEPKVKAAVLDDLADRKLCRRDASLPGSAPLCDQLSLCEIEPVTEEAKSDCFSSRPREQQAPGYCYIDPTKGPNAGGRPGPGGGCEPGNEKTWGTCTSPHLTGCGATERRMLRFVGQDTPRAGSTTVVACAGEEASATEKLPPLPQAGGN